MKDSMTKERIMKAVAALPPDATIEDAMERLYFLAKVEKGRAQIEAGESIPHEEARKRLLD